MTRLATGSLIPVIAPQTIAGWKLISADNEASRLSGVPVHSVGTGDNWTTCYTQYINCYKTLKEKCWLKVKTDNGCIDWSALVFENVTLIFTCQWIQDGRQMLFQCLENILFFIQNKAGIGPALGKYLWGCIFSQKKHFIDSLLIYCCASTRRPLNKMAQLGYFDPLLDIYLKYLFRIDRTLVFCFM